MAAHRHIRLHADDNVIVAVDALAPGIAVGGITASSRIPNGHKLASAAIPSGNPVLKFGQIIGFATSNIAAGEHVHEHNCAVAEFQRDYRFAEGARDEDVLPEGERRTFDGFRRPGGKVGTRNYIGVLTSVNCSASVARFIAEAYNRTGMLDEFPNVDGVVSFVHGTGCGMAGSGEGFELFERTLWGYACLLYTSPSPRDRS